MNNQVSDASQAARRRIALAVGTEGMGTLLPLVLKALASEEPAEITGTFVEDQNLLNLAALPVFKEVCRVSRAATAPQQQDLTRQLRLRANAVRSAVLQAAEASGARWSFHVAQGSICAEARKSAQDADLVVIASARRAVTTRADTRLYAEEWVSVPLQTRRKVTQDANRPIALFVQRGEIPRRALNTAISIARRFQRPMIVLSENPTVDLNAAIVNVSNRTVQPRLIGVPNPTPERLAEAVRDARAALLVAPALDAFLEADALRHFHEESHAPTLLVHETASTAA